MELTRDYLIGVQMSQLVERSAYVKDEVMAELIKVLDEHNKRVVNPNNILRGVDLDTMLSNYGLHQIGKGGYPFESYYGLTKI